jgi:hypothetical protein
MGFDLISYCSSNSREYTYIGIGSKNRVNEVSKFTPDMDQIMPCFLDTIKDKTIRMIHFDPQFATEDNNFLTRYFNSKGFSVQDIGGHRSWVSSDFRIEVIIVSEMFDENSLFLKAMMSQAIKYKSKLVVQMYTGSSMDKLFKNLYYCFIESEKQYIRDNILFDITYGDSHCMTNMTENAPMIDKNGKFYNFLLYSENDMFNSIGLLPKMDELIKVHVMKKLSTILNENHVNYRKAVRGEPLLFNSPYYGIFAKAEEIMQVLLGQTRDLLSLLEKLGSLSKEKQDLFNVCSKNYNEMDMYKWYSEMTKLYK